MADEADLRLIGEQMKCIETKLEVFRETVDDRFDQTIELLKSGVRTLSNEISELKKS